MNGAIFYGKNSGLLQKKMFNSNVAGLQHFYRYKNTLAYYVQIVLKHCANDGVINSVIHTGLLLTKMFYSSATRL